MPTYDYRCKNCGHEFELFQSMTETPKRKCPQCGKNALERLIGTGAALLFKGSGFYQTDYRSESYKKAAQEEKPAPAGANAEAKGADKPAGAKDTDAKPAAPSPPSEGKAGRSADPKPTKPGSRGQKKH